MLTSAYQEIAVNPLKEYDGTMQKLLFSFLLILNLQGYTIKDLGVVSNDFSMASGINNQNWVVGKTEIDGVKHDFVWDPEKGLTVLAFKVTSQVPLVNNQNQMVGIHWVGGPLAWIINSRSKQIYLMGSDDVYKNIDPPRQWKIETLELWQKPTAHDEKDFGIIGFNDLGQLLVCNALNATKATEFALWEKGTYTFIDESELSCAYGLNNAGLILGQKMIEMDHVETPMLVVYDLQRKAYQFVMPDHDLIRRGFNDRGDVFAIKKDKEGAMHGFIWVAHEGLEPLEDFIPVAFNNHLEMLGSFKNSTFDCMWHKGQILNLSDYISTPWSHIQWLHAINDNGHVVGLGVINGKKHAFLLSPE